LAADMQGRLPGTQLQPAIQLLLRANDAAARAARQHAASACTDVSGFGLAGHLGELLRASGVSARIDAHALPVLPGALDLIRRGLRSSFHQQNTQGRREIAVAPDFLGDPSVELLFDPQTSGGLLFGVDTERADAALRSLHAAGDEQATVIGGVTPLRSDGALFEVAASEGGDGSS
jgi:selenide,water dikinase